MSQIKVYGKDGCGYCTKATRLLEKNGIEFTYIDVEDMFFDKDDFVENISGGRTTLPVILNQKKIIGGFDELAELHRTNIEVSAVRKLLNSAIVRIKFTTATGEERDIIGTTMQEFLPVKEDGSVPAVEAEKHPLEISDRINIFVIDKGAWRSFNYKNLTYMDVQHDD